MLHVSQYLRPLIASITALLGALPLAADPSAGDQMADDPQLSLDPIVVVASRIPQRLSGVAAQVTVIDGEDIRRNLVEDISGLLKYEPGLDLETSGTRFGASAINIRGIGGNRVDIRIDGVPLRDQFIIGAFSNGGRLAIEPDRIKQVEVLHGPASAMYGSNALGGVIAVTTWDPADLLNSAGDFGSYSLRTGYQGMNSSRVVSAMAAGGGHTHRILAAATYRDGNELDNQAPSIADAQDWDSDDLMVRYTWDLRAGQRLRFSAERMSRETRTEVDSVLGFGQRFRWTTALLGNDRDERRRLSLDYEFDLDSGTQGVFRLYDSSHDTDQFSRETRAAAPSPVALERRFKYAQDITGAEASLHRTLSWLDLEHRIGIGAEWNRSTVTELRDGTQTSLNDGSHSKNILGETFPLRDFPISDSDEVGVWLQDEIRLAGGRWSITPALRWDRYELSPEADPIWREDNPDTAVVSVDEARLTPRLSVVFRPGDTWAFYGQYSEGFRAPPFEDANVGLDIPLFGIRAIPNPDLRSETSQAFEIGMRWFGPYSTLSAALFHTEYDDFIESRVLIGRDPGTGDLVFQSRNIAQARIRGIDLRYEGDLSGFNARLQGWTVHAAAYWAEGENRQSGVPLNSIAPPQAVAGLAWDSRDGVWRLAATGTFTAAKHSDDIDESEAERFATPGWTTLDLTLGWHPSARLEFQFGLFNLTDRHYWRWLDVARLQADDPMIPLLSRSGRSFSLSARIISF
ncbi:MAG: TonB-dependent hemoglobin/transferrin/lactoferrin family receptor [Xanthomonadales bacterium]|nr:TonB-dependent hemoglobin/transferrin/lactoferrin family receptor [Xanthomonadales bacterium]